MFVCCLCDSKIACSLVLLFLVKNQIKPPPSNRPPIIERVIIIAFQLLELLFFRYSFIFF
ncbi:MAG: hypothetical protein MRECE_34c009 [Mycoplasmataceae bacterium CE_OT135]|nr:MAG: hypothetical protein MRECE_34c009 [Mycoplasmataceae bacterium CE_OT135]